MKLKDLLLEFDVKSVADGFEIKKTSPKSAKGSSVTSAKEIGFMVYGRNVLAFDLSTGKSIAGVKPANDEQCSGSWKVKFSDGSTVSFSTEAYNDDWSNFKDPVTISGIKSSGVTIGNKPFTTKHDGNGTKSNSFTVSFSEPTSFTISGQGYCSNEK